MKHTALLLGSLLPIFAWAVAGPCSAAQAPAASHATATRIDALQWMDDMPASALAPISNPAQTNPAEKAACLARMHEFGMPAEQHCSIIVVPLRDFSPHDRQILRQYHAYYDCAEPLREAKTNPDKLASACARVAGGSLQNIRMQAFQAMADVESRLSRQKQGTEDCKRAQTAADREKYCELNMADIMSIHMWLHRPYALGVRQMLNEAGEQPSIGAP